MVRNLKDPSFGNTEASINLKGPLSFRYQKPARNDYDMVDHGLGPHVLVCPKLHMVYPPLFVSIVQGESYTGRISSHQKYRKIIATSIR